MWLCKSLCLRIFSYRTPKVSILEFCSWNWRDQEGTAEPTRSNRPCSFDYAKPHLGNLVRRTTCITRLYSGKYNTMQDIEAQTWWIEHRKFQVGDFGLIKGIPKGFRSRSNFPDHNRHIKKHFSWRGWIQKHNTNSSNITPKN